MLVEFAKREVFLPSPSELETLDGDVGQESKIRLATMLPALARWCHTVVHGLPNELVEVCPDCSSRVLFIELINKLPES